MSAPFRKGVLLGGPAALNIPWHIHDLDAERVELHVIEQTELGARTAEFYIRRDQQWVVFRWAPTYTPEDAYAFLADGTAAHEQRVFDAYSVAKRDRDMTGSRAGFAAAVAEADARPLSGAEAAAYLDALRASRTNGGTS